MPHRYARIKAASSSASPVHRRAGADHCAASLTKPAPSEERVRPIPHEDLFGHRKRGTASVVSRGRAQRSALVPPRKPATSSGVRTPFGPVFLVLLLASASAAAQPSTTAHSDVGGILHFGLLHRISYCGWLK